MNLQRGATGLVQRLKLQEQLFGGVLVSDNPPKPRTCITLLLSPSLTFL